jgi:hypothetical protein
MKVVKNISLQGLQIPFSTPNGVKYVFLAPKKQVQVPSTWSSQVVENLTHRRMVKYTVVADPAPTPVTPIKNTRKRVN